jgi:hypothetical protein
MSPFKPEVERKNEEIEQARRALEEKATELALTSKYKSEFLANMSHELRTPLNSILILGQQLADNRDGNLTPRQVEFSRTIHGAGTDLLNLISDILDLSKIESGTVSVEAEEVSLSVLEESVARPFRHEAERRGLSFDVALDRDLGSIATDSKRLQQVLKNLLSNAIKFTEQGGVRMRVSRATSGWTPSHPVLSAASTVVAFEVMVCAPVHDALLIESSIGRIEADVERLRKIMDEASELVLGAGKRVRADDEPEIVRWPDRYADERGLGLFETIRAELEKLLIEEKSEQEIETI